MVEPRLVRSIVFYAPTADYHQIFERYKCKNDWEAHKKLILASTVTTYRNQPYLITGGNDDCVAVWDLAETYTLPVKGPKPSNGNHIQFLFVIEVLTCP
jgi:hypothetical protein